MYIREQLENGLKAAVEKAVNAAVADGAFSIEHLPAIQLEVPREAQFGDYATNVAMQLPGQAHMAPRAIAEAIVGHFDAAAAYVQDVTIAGPGFINFALDPTWHYEVIGEIEAKGADYGRTTGNAGKTYNLEFVSANPTGPMHMGNARGGAIGDVLAEIAAWTGYDVTREFYVNDAGNQIAKFGDSLDARFRQLLGEDIPFPEDGYQGADIRAHMEEYIAENGGKAAVRPLLDRTPETRKALFVDYALKKNLRQMHADMESYGVDYDVWFSEQSMYDDGEIERALKLLKDKGATYDKEGATWFKTTDYGCEKDDVLIRQNGLPTYFMGDIAYHLNKLLTRGFDRAVNVWGADHHGHIARLKAAIAAAGVDASRLEIVTMQLVRLIRDGEPVRMSKRQGKAIGLTELLDMVGIDAARVFFNLRSPDSHFDFDLDLAIRQSNDNPVFYVQYAHARIASILRQLGGDVDLAAPAKLELLTNPKELELLSVLSDFPETIVAAEHKMDPSRMVHYAQRLASAFHTFYNECRVRVDDADLMHARLKLILACRQVLENVLGILGVDAPEAM
ncbi:arginine--tRNA ligase [Pseudoramibacter alactolyticus ATCC 23263]|uniref:Arginine--tRNA ligase n=1 Tax=Pseudoramibacter alactolyticus ATCC 23263 TaxID=887929 RepID=E6MID1_9FIRM|nr:arginine--tRNA ligase [Pseudoramibacter alactolyticus]EFV01027.1 arginine--tRNA ligase [Pseudoramibacter alactolyticus ATCC 23263]